MKTYWNLTSIFLVAGAIAISAISPASSPVQTEIQRRSQTQSEWRTIATVSGAAALLGALKKDNTLAFAGAAGALYALYRYDEDSKSKDRLARTRAAYFSNDHFYRDGVRYDRRVVTQSGKKFYQFYKAPKSHQDWKSEGLHDNRNNEHSNRNHDKHPSKNNGHGVGVGKWKSNDNGKGKGNGSGKGKGKGEGQGEGQGQGHGKGKGHGGGD